MTYNFPIGKGDVLMYAHLETDTADGNLQHRSAPRHRLYLSATAKQAQDSRQVEILDISAGGLLMRTSDRLVVDQPLTVVLPGPDEHEAQVAWSGDELYGCRFAVDLTKAQLSAALLRARPQHALAPRPEERDLSDETLGQRIKRLREASPHSMIALAEKVGVTKPTLWKWETDKVRPRGGAVKALASVFGIDELDLLYGGAQSVQPQVRAAAVGGHTYGINPLAEMVASSRAAIAQLAGVDERKVRVSIDW